MGLDFYARSSASSSSSSNKPASVSPANAAFSKAADKAVGKRKCVHPDTLPKNRTIKSNAKKAIVVALDVTGSMGDWSKIIYDKLPMFYGQLIMQRYLNTDPNASSSGKVSFGNESKEKKEVPAIAFLAIGDIASDNAPLQVTNFAQGNAIDKEVKKLWLEGAGGMNQVESYLAAMWFCASPRVVMPNHVGKPFLFITGDEGLNSFLDATWIKQHVDPNAKGVPCCAVSFRVPNDPSISTVDIKTEHAGIVRIRREDAVVQSSRPPPSDSAQQDAKSAAPESSYETWTAHVPGADSWTLEAICCALKKKYHVFHLKKPYHSKRFEVGFLKQWNKALGAERVLLMQNPRACVDVMLGAIALVSGARTTLEEYIEDLKEREQSPQRRAEVKKCLLPLSKSLSRMDESIDMKMLDVAMPLKLLSQNDLRIVRVFGDLPKDIRDQVRGFVQSGAQGSNFTIPKPLVGWQRGVIHGAVHKESKGAVKSYSAGEEGKRFITLSKSAPGKAVHAKLSSFTCPISQELMKDPVIASDGFSYERERITKWFKRSKVSPMTGKTLTNASLVQNIALRQAIEEYVKSQAE